MFDEERKDDRGAMLPDLPKQYDRKEAKIDGEVIEWFLNNYPEDVLIEVKVKGNYPTPGQKIVLNEVARGEFSYKFPDMGRATPGDGIVLKKAHAFVVTCDGRKCHAVQIGGNKKTIDFHL